MNMYNEALAMKLGSGKMLVPDIVFQGIVSLLSFGAVDPH